MREVFPKSVHRYCVHHLLANIRTSTNLSSDEEYLTISIAHSIDETDYKEKFEKLKVCKPGTVMK